MSIPASRRHFLEISSASLAVAFLRAFDAHALGRPVKLESPFGPLLPSRDGATGQILLEIPRGFRYVTLGWAGDPMVDGGKTPGHHDGMAAFATKVKSRVRLVRNHEVRGAGPAFAGGARGLYDASAPGGTTTIEFDTKSERAISTAPSLCGTSTNCAGGPTPWASWLSCEEIVAGPAAGSTFSQPHGYVFEVPSSAVSNGQPITGMGRFVHEAVAIDPATGAAYLTEDAARAGLYRYMPRKKGDLAAGGTLSMLAIDRVSKADMRDTPSGGPSWPVRWVEIADPSRGHVNDAEKDAEGVFRQGYDQGGAMFRRLEGIWHGGGKMYFTSTSGGKAKLGQVYELDLAKQELTLVYESANREALQAPDNLCVSPKGGLVICEDGSKPNSIRGLSPSGALFTLARNVAVLDGSRNGLSGDASESEFAGATFSPDGKWLFFNIQRPGVTIAMTGPWAEAGL